jgi:5-formyltetrahydrofolate cyclo-ligase
VTAGEPWSSVGAVDDPTRLKAAIRRDRREWRRALGRDEVAERSDRIWGNMLSEPTIVSALDTAGSVMVFTPIHGEPVLDALRLRCLDRGVGVVTPEDDPDPASVDVVVVPGVAFTPAGDRLGQGGGWYDRFLCRLAPATLTIGVCFAEQLVDELPCESHDVRVGRVVTDAADRTRGGQPSS